MTDTAVTEQSHVSPELEALAAAAELRDVRQVRAYAELFERDAVPVVEIHINIDSSFRRTDTGLEARFDVTVPIRTKSNESIADLGTATVMAFDVASSVLDAASDATIEVFVTDIGFRMAMPFIREAVQTLSIRIGLPAVTLGLLHPGQSGPRTASVRAPDPEFKQPESQT